MYTITYNLKDLQPSSAVFYSDLKAYSNLVYHQLDELFYDEVIAFFHFQLHEGTTDLYSYSEAYLELLTLGVLWTVYSGDTMATKDSATELLQMLADIRETNKPLKPLVDAVRGICLTSMMSPDLYDHMGFAPPNRFYFKALLDWLEATGEFKVEAGRLKSWERYLNTLSEEKANTLLEVIIKTGLWFEQDSIEKLGTYTQDVERYLNELRPKRYWKEDVIFCGRRRVEYHLNMLGAEWLNQSYREAFCEKEQRLVLMPTCMKLLSSEACKAQTIGEWQICSQCHDSCQVGQISKLQELYRFKSYMVPHSSDLLDMPVEIEKGKVAILGISCTLNLISGGWMLSKVGIPAQCVLLDYCGCKGHWHHEGIPTSLNLEILKELLR